MTQLLTTEEVAERCRTTPSTVRHWRRTNKGPLGFKLAKAYVYDAADVEEWLREQKARASQERGARR